jgi:TolB-like protein/Flp pilus assembly protein TadD
LRRRRRWIAVTAGLGAVAAVAAVLIANRLNRTGNPAPPPLVPPVQATVTGAGPKRLAVLPFENLGDSADAYFADGITDEVRGKLAGLPGLRVIARTSSSQYRGTRKAPQEIGRELAVDYLLTATVRWEKPANGRSRVRVTPELIQAAEATTRWQQPFDAPLTDVFQVQGDIAGRVAQALGVALTAGERERLVHRPTENLAAYDLYLQGRQFWNQRTPSALQTAARYFERAIARDSTYAEAYAGLAENYAIFPSYDVSPPREAYPKAKTAALRALALDSTLGQAVAVLARVRMEYDWDWRGAEGEYRRALALAPSYPTGHELYAIYLSLLGRHEEALAEIERARALDPLSRIIGSMKGVLLDLSRRHDEAIAQFRRTLELDPDFAHAHLGLGLAYLTKGMRAEGIAELETAVRLTGRRTYTGELAYAYAASGQRGRALALARELEDRSRREYVSPVTVALAYTGLGDKDGAFRWLERAADLRDPGVLVLRVEPLFDPLRSDPRFTRLLTRVGLQ